MENTEKTIKDLQQQILLIKKDVNHLKQILNGCEIKYRDFTCSPSLTVETSPEYTNMYKK